jgi:riboflavin biosynthesis pyrimidine reductase
MSLFHAVVWLDHHQANVLQFDAEHVQAEKVKASSRHSKQHGNAVRTEHEFYADVCAALDGIAEVLVTGGSSALADFKHYVDKHRAALAPRIVGYETVDHPSDKQLVALARQYFLRHDRMAGVPTPT